jgi:hypothetical protein
MPDLSRLVERARAARVADADARAYVAELGRWARVEAEPRRRWWPAWIGGGFALAAATLVVWLLVGRRDVTGSSPLQIGARVAIVAEPNTSYRVVSAEAARTEILVERGSVTARLFHGERAHELVLTDGFIHANAVGTMYTLTVSDRGSVVDVHEGTVEVWRDVLVGPVTAGSSWPPGATYRQRPAVTALRELESLPATLRMLPAMVQRDAAIEMPDAEPTDVGVVPGDAKIVRQAVPDAAAAAPERSLTDRWRQARLLRGQGDFEAAVRECLAIADARDPTWSPIALVEAARIELGPRASPERTISLVDRFLAEWASHQLAPEARELRCRALRQLGREAECTTTP